MPILKACICTSVNTFNTIRVPMYFALGNHRRVTNSVTYTACEVNICLLLSNTGQELPADFPLLAICGPYDMLANATPAEIQDAVWACLDQGVTQALPPADIHPPAQLENIAAFVEAHRSFSRGIERS